VSAERIIVSDVSPQVDCGRWPAKACVGDRVEIGATIVRDGHETLRAVVRYRRPKGRWREAPLAALASDRFAGTFDVDAIGRWRFEVEAWVDRHAGWVAEHDRKVAAGQADLAGELAEGAALFRTGEVDDWRAAAPELGARDRHGVVRSEPLELEVERERARTGAWYELFPRSWGGLDGVAGVVPELAELGFDIVYLPPIHPIGHTNRKGATTPSGRSRETSGPWAIGAAGGTTRSTPVWATRTGLAGRGELHRHGMELALDLLRCRCRPDTLARGAPGVVPAPSRRVAQVRREPAEALPGHPQRRLGDP
jgi:starch synthase (maltosyl-transferring)